MVMEPRTDIDVKEFQKRVLAMFCLPALEYIKMFGSTAAFS